ncbi:hypothetical protein VNO78_19572 [Psophocarpus tetragonolobus]|uniref:tRNA intron endonuclease N-terminal domain-containing protein n=1 Tax=Psophocarpus tetragonolobus TaxID=3891 RepID=A0AAN9XGD4_PSOTE
MVENSFKPDVFMRNILLRGLCTEGMLEKAFNFFNLWISKEYSVDVVTYNTLISSLCKEGRLEEAFNLVTEVEGKKLVPDLYTYDAIVNMLTRAGRTEEAEKIMALLLESVQYFGVHLAVGAEQLDLLDKACFGRPVRTVDKDKNWFQLCFEETFYLCDSLKCLKINGSDTGPQNDEELWHYMKSQKETFPYF